MPAATDFLAPLLRMSHRTGLILLMAGQLFWACLLWQTTESGLLAAVCSALPIATVQALALWIGTRPHGPYLQRSVSVTLAAILLVLAAALGWWQEPLQGLIFWLLTVQWALALQARTRQSRTSALLLSPLALLLASPAAAHPLWLPGLLIFWTAWLTALVHSQGNNEPTPNTAVQSTGNSPVSYLRQQLPLLLMTGLLPILALLVWLALPVGNNATLQLLPYHSPLRHDSKDWLGQALRGDTPQDSILTAESQAASEGPQGLWDAVSRDTPQFDYPGFADRMDLFDTAAIGGQPQDQVLQVRSPRPLYLKVHTFDYFDGQIWSNSSLSYQKLATAQDQLTLTEVLPAHCQNRHTESFAYEVRVQQAISAWLPLADTTQKLTIAADAIALDNWRQPLLSEPLQAGSRYQAHALSGHEQQHPLACSPAPARADLRVPAADLGWLRELALASSTGASGTAARAIRIEQYLRTQYQATLNQATITTAPLMRDRSLLVQVLQERRSGNNEMLATGLVMMLRAIDIPARLVAGFSATRYNPLTGFYDVQQQDGHTWVEAWDGHHWISLEADARYNLPQQRDYTTRAHAMAAAQGDHASAWGWQLLGALLWPLNLVLTSLSTQITLLALLGLWIWPTSRQLVLDALIPLRQRWWLECIRRYRSMSPAQDIRRVYPWLRQLAYLCGMQSDRGEPHEHWCQRLQARFPEMGSEDIELLQSLLDRYFYEGNHVAWQQVLDQLQGLEHPDQVAETTADANEIRELFLELALRMVQRQS